MSPQYQYQPYVYIDPAYTKGITDAGRPFGIPGLNWLQDRLGIGADAKLDELYSKDPSLKYAPPEALLPLLNDWDTTVNSADEILSQHKRRLSMLKNRMDPVERARLRSNPPDYYEYIDGVDSMNMDQIYKAAPEARKKARNFIPPAVAAGIQLNRDNIEINRVQQLLQAIESDQNRALQRSESAADRRARAESEQRLLQRDKQKEDRTFDIEIMRNDAETKRAQQQQAADLEYAKEVNRSRDARYDRDMKRYEREKLYDGLERLGSMLIEMF
tara:strand:- start:54 stop:872 length:819 start_codon:yes stop_codon:yes gene_type:complete